MRMIIVASVLCAIGGAPAFACGYIPPIGVEIDAKLLGAHLSEADTQKVKDLRKDVARLVAEKKTESARETEEQAMRILGYRKSWLRCGPGTFVWMKW